MRRGQRQYRLLHQSRPHPHRGASVVVMPRRRKTARSRVSGLLRTQRRCRRAFSLSPARVWARRTAQTRCSGIFLEIPAVFCYFWNATAGAETAGLSPAAAPGPVSRHSEHADTSWVCAQAVRNARTAAFCNPNSVFWRHISGGLSAPFGGVRGPNLSPNMARIGNKTQPSPRKPPRAGNFPNRFFNSKFKAIFRRNANKKRRFFPQGLSSASPAGCTRVVTSLYEF